MTAIENAQQLAARFVNYCRSNALSLNGLVDRVAAEYTLTDDTCKAVILHCHEHALELGGLVELIGALRHILIHDPIASGICDDVAARHGRVASIEDTGLRFKQGVSADGGVTLSRVHQVGFSIAHEIASDVVTMIKGVRVTVEVGPDATALFYHVTTLDDSGNMVQM